MLTAMRFLEWLTTRGLTLADATQADVDVWLDAGRAARRQLLADFVRWSNQHGLTNRIDVPTGRRTEPDLSMTSEERSAQLRRALSDEAVPVDVRAAAALLFLYGIPVSHIARIQLDDLVVHRGQAHLAVYGHRTVLPPAVDRLIRAAADAARPRSTVGQVVPGHEVAVRWRRGYADTSSRSCPVATLPGWSSPERFPPRCLAWSSASVCLARRTGPGGRHETGTRSSRLATASASGHHAPLGEAASVR